MPLSHPTVILAALWLALAIADAARRRLGWSGSEFASVLFVTFGLGFVAAYLAIAVWYAASLSYFDPAEPTIAAVAAAFRAGHTLYPALDAPERYAHIYGPVLFLTHASAFAMFGSGILVSKAVGAVAIVLALGASFHVYRERAGIYAAMLATAVGVTVYLAFNNVTFWSRPDPLLILCAAFGLLATRLRSPRGSMVLLGAATGVAANLKVTGVLYLLPAVAMSVAAHGARAVTLAAAVAALTAIAPFLVSGVSIANYWDYLALSARNGVNAGRLRQNAEWLVYLGAPAAALAWSAWRRGSITPHLRAGLLALAPATLLIAIVSAKPGGGPFHLLPFVPVLGYVVLNVPRTAWGPASRTLALAFAITSVAFAIPRQLIFVSTMVNRDLTPAVDAIRKFAEAHPGESIAVGYAGTSDLSFARPEAVFRTGDYFLDVPAIQEHRLAGLPLPDATRLALVQCRAQYMLLPPGTTAFTVQSAYYPDGPRDVFPEEFRAEFLRRYRRIGSDVFDIWRCTR
jgi:hypothetical protein